MHPFCQDQTRQDNFIGTDSIKVAKMYIKIYLLLFYICGAWRTISTHRWQDCMNTTFYFHNLTNISVCVYIIFLMLLKGLFHILLVLEWRKWKCQKENGKQCMMVQDREWCTRSEMRLITKMFRSKTLFILVWAVYCCEDYVQWCCMLYGIDGSIASLHLNMCYEQAIVPYWLWSE